MVFRRIFLSAFGRPWYDKEQPLPRRFFAFCAGAVIAIISGAALGLAFPLTDIFPLAWIAFVPLLVMQRGISVKRMWLFAFLAGMSFWLVLAYWMHVFHVMALFTAVPALALYFSLPFLFLSVWQRISRDRFPWLDPLLFSLFWAGVEYFRSTGFLGYSWGLAGYSQTAFLPILQIADIAGVWGVSFLVVFANAVVAYLFRQDTRRRKRILLCCLGALLGFSLLYGALRLSEKPSGAEYKVHLIQAFVDPETDWARDRYAETMQKITDLTLQAGKGGGDLIIWPETLSHPPGMYYWKYLRMAPEDNSDRRIAEWFVGMPDRAGRAVLLTAPHRDRVAVTNVTGSPGLEMQSYNAAFLVTPGTNVLDSYYKINLVPFGEWFPYKKEFPFVAKILRDTVASDFTPGTRYTVFRERDTAFSVVICFEDIFGGLCRQFVLGGAEFLINTTNDYWSRSVQSQEQHAAMAILRAIENRRYMVRAANTGVTCVIDAWGRMQARLPNHTVGILDGNISLMRGYGQSVYTRHGDFLGIAGAYLGGLALVLGLLFNLYKGLQTGFRAAWKTYANEE
jgi:apolipoprotein N-acyltransferase